MPATHFHRNGLVGRNVLAHASHNFQRYFRLAEQEAAAAPAEHLLHRAAEVDVDHVVAGRGHLRGSRAEFFRIAPHQLSAHQMIVCGDAEKSQTILAAGLQNHPIEHHLAQGIRRTQLASDAPHGPIAVARQRSLHDRKSDLDVTDL